jgi:hypothetical protein
MRYYKGSPEEGSESVSEISADILHNVTSILPFVYNDIKQMQNVYNIFAGPPEVIDYLEEFGVDVGSLLTYKIYLKEIICEDVPLDVDRWRTLV